MKLPEKALVVFDRMVSLSLSEDQRYSELGLDVNGEVVEFCLISTGTHGFDCAATDEQVHTLCIAALDHYVKMTKEAIASARKSGFFL